MPTVILPAADVLKAAEGLLAAIEQRSANPTFQRAITFEMRKADPHSDKLTAIVDAAKWLVDMEVPNGMIGLTLEEARMLEPMLPRYDAA